jgi:hypothetical protein
MANIMSMQKLRNNPSRSGFDLSKRRAFSSNTGEILPFHWINILPGDEYEIDLSSFVRTNPVQTPAYTRIKEYYDVVFVPYNLLWNKFNTWVVQMGDNRQTADSFNSAMTLGDVGPYFTLFQVLDVYGTLRNTPQEVDMFGIRRSHSMRKLFWYLGYGDLEKYYEDGYIVGDEQSNSSRFVNSPLNPYPLLAYHKVYSDYYRNTQWEKSEPATFNVNYLFTNNMNIPFSQMQQSYAHNIVQLHYANWEKDLFMGLMPNSQFGNSASIDISSILNETSGFNQFGLSTGVNNVNGQVGITNRNLTVNGSPNWYMSKDDVDKLSVSLGLDRQKLESAFTVLQLRKAEAEQKFREITQSVHQDYQSQIKAHWDVNVSDAYSERSVFVDGVDGVLNISEVINQNLTDNNAANIQGKGIGAMSGKMKFSSSVHGILMFVYHNKPRLDYALRTALPKKITAVNVVDYAIPEFDKIGMDSVSLLELFNDKLYEDILIGYAPRYYEMKTDIDDVVGSYIAGGFSDWVAPITEEYLQQNYGNSRWSFNTFKVNPHILDSIFTMDVADSGFETDQFKNLVNIDIKAVRKLDRDGLPY